MFTMQSKSLKVTYLGAFVSIPNKCAAEQRFFQQRPLLSDRSLSTTAVFTGAVQQIVY
jgi:hypothetical protein